MLKVIFSGVIRFSERHTPKWLHKALFVHKYFHFFATGATGVGINLFTTWVLTTFVFGLERYFAAYLVGVLLNLAFNFTIHTIVTFKEKNHVVERIIGFGTYSISMTLFQAWVVKTLTPIVGLQYYLLVIAAVILLFSIVTFLLFKFFLFRPIKEGEDSVILPQLLLIAIFSSVILHLTGLLDVFFTKGLTSLLAGDAQGYVDLGKHLWQGRGFVSMTQEGVYVPELFRTPGLPLILAPFTAFPWGIHAYLVLQTVFVSIALPFLVYTLGRKLFSVRAGIIAAWFIALEPQIMFSSWSPLSEMPFLVSILGAVLLYYSIREWNGCRFCFWARLALSGALAGYAVLVKPGMYPIVIIFFSMIIIGDLLAKKYKTLLVTIGVMLVFFLFISPLQIRNAALTGEYTLSATGWWNLYVDYIASIRVTETGAEFSSQRAAQKTKAVQELGLKTGKELSSPVHAPYLRAKAIEEIRNHFPTVLKMETLFLISYFTNDNYYNQLIRNGFVPVVRDRMSPSQILLRQGLSGIPRILEEMKKQYFVPIFARLYQFFILGAAAIGLWRAPRRLAVLCGVVIVVAALTSTVLGYAVEARLRIPIMPILFIFAGYAIAGGLPSVPFLRRMKSHES